MMEAVRTSETSVYPTRLHGATFQKALIFKRKFVCGSFNDAFQ
jgi:hypothetical protein